MQDGAAMMTQYMSGTDSETGQERMLARLSRVMRSRLGGHLRRLVLFGSRARGDARADSDYDLLVVVDEVSREVKDAVDEIAGEMLYRFGIVVSAFPTSEEDAQSRKYSPLLMNVAKEGVPV
jgi:predicted nucleotidyltransferase